jgi:hypothetical protein
MKTTLKEITITPAPLALARLTHAAPLYAAQSLQTQVEALERAGLEVTAARSLVCSVPTSYRYTMGMQAPCWFYDPEALTIAMREHPLKSRTHGLSTPARFTVRGLNGKPPFGFKCVRRGGEDCELVAD